MKLSRSDFLETKGINPVRDRLPKATVRRLRRLTSNGINRIIDANINRAKEGLRVCEEITRFILNNRKLTSDFKTIRHRIDDIIKYLPVSLPDLLKMRESQEDVGRNIYLGELKRKNLSDIFSANIQRVKESIRVLEEFSKLINIKFAIKFKRVRYNIYEIEKKTAGKILSLSNRRQENRLRR